MEAVTWGRGDGATVSRADVVAEARSWVGTPFMHQGDRKRIGTDCAGLIRGTSAALGLIPANFRELAPHLLAYGRLPDNESMQAYCESFLTPIERDAMQPADVVMARFDSGPQHLGIVVPYRHGGLAIVHAASRYGAVIETRLMFGTSPLSMKFVAAYALPGVA